MGADKRKLVLNGKNIPRLIYPKVYSISKFRDKYRSNGGVSIYPAVYKWETIYDNASMVPYENIDNKFIRRLDSFSLYGIEAFNIAFISPDDIDAIISSCSSIYETRGGSRNEAKLKGRITALINLLKLHQSLRTKAKYLLVF